MHTTVLCRRASRIAPQSANPRPLRRLRAGGHLSHGYQTDTKKISATSIFFEVRPWQLLAWRCCA